MKENDGELSHVHVQRLDGCLVSETDTFHSGSTFYMHDGNRDTK